MITRRGFFSGSAAMLAAAGCQTLTGNDAPVPAQPRAEGAWTLGKVGFRLGVAGYTYHKYKIDETLKFMEKLDLHWLCIKDFHLPMSATDAEIKEFHKKCADHGVTGYAVGPIYMKGEEEAKRAFDYAARVGVKTIVAVPYEMRKVNGKEVRYESRKELEFVDKLVKEYNVKYAIHNHGPDIPYLFPIAESVWAQIKDLDSRIGFCLDIGHQFRDNRDPVAAIKKYGARIYDMHLKNVSDNSKKGGAMPFPRGKMDLFAIAKAVKEIGYTGCMSIEYERDFTDNFGGMAESVGYFRGIMDALRD